MATQTYTIQNATDKQMQALRKYVALSFGSWDVITINDDKASVLANTEYTTVEGDTIHLNQYSVYYVIEQFCSDNGLKIDNALVDRDLWGDWDDGKESQLFNQGIIDANRSAQDEQQKLQEQQDAIEAAGAEIITVAIDGAEDLQTTRDSIQVIRAADGTEYPYTNQGVKDFMASQATQPIEVMIQVYGSEGGFEIIDTNGRSIAKDYVLGYHLYITLDVGKYTLRKWFAKYDDFVHEFEICSDGSIKQDAPALVHRKPATIY